TRLNGSSPPPASRPWRRAMMSSNLLNRSPVIAVSSSKVGSIAAELADRIDQLAEILDLRLLVHADDDVEFVLDRGDEIHHGQAVELEVASEGGFVRDLGALLVEGGDQRANAGIDVSAVHGQAPRARLRRKSGGGGGSQARKMSALDGTGS